VCDLTKIILEDGKCFYNGYIESNNGKVYRYSSNTPQRGAVDLKLKEKVKIGDNVIKKRLHFINNTAMLDYLTDNGVNVKSNKALNNETHGNNTFKETKSRRLSQGKKKTLG
jgi:hypothetical protein